VAISRSATAVGAVTIETLAFERSELLVPGANEPDDTLALRRGEFGEAFAHRPPDTLALRWGEFGQLFACHPPETLALEWGELGIAFAHHPLETPAAEAKAASAKAAPAKADCGIAVIARVRDTEGAPAGKGRRSQSSTGCRNRHGGQTNCYPAHHDAHSKLSAPQPFVNQTQRSYRGCNRAAQSRGGRQSARYVGRPQVAIGSGVAAGSLTLTTFGIDSLIELASACVLVWRLSIELRHGQVFARSAERTASRIGGALLFALAAYVVASAGWKLWTREGAELSLPGLVISVLAVPAMYFLSWRKLQVASALGSRALVDRPAGLTRNCLVRGP
jgi:hypothetical protein